MATANKIIKSALRLIKVKAANESISAAEGEDGLEALNDLIDSFTNEDLMQFYREEHVMPFVNGKATYTFGIGGDINETRSVAIENAFVRDEGGTDWEIQEINNDQYQEIILKTTGSTYPVVFFYRPKFPLGEISFWPVPSVNTELHINVRTQLQKFTDINENIDFPPGYVRAFKYGLAIEIAPEYRRDISPLIKETYISAKEFIQDTNNKNIPILESDLFDYYGRWGKDYGRYNSGGSCPPTGPAIITETGSTATTITETGSEPTIIVESGAI